MKTEKIVGYVLLVVGLVFVILPALLALSMFLGGTVVPQSVGADLTGGLSNVFLMFFLLIVIAWAGSITSSRGVALIKEIRLRVVRESLGEEVEVVKKAEKT